MSHDWATDPLPANGEAVSFDDGEPPVSTARMLLFVQPKPFVIAMTPQETDEYCANCVKVDEIQWGP